MVVSVVEDVLVVDDIDKFKALSLESQLENLKNVKLKILGNDKDKERLIKNGSLANLVDILRDDSDLQFQVLKDVAVVISSFSYSKKNSNYLVQQNIIEILILSCISHYSLCEYHFKTLINILSFHPELKIDLSTESGSDLIRLFIKIISNKSTNTLLLFSTCILLPYLSASYLTPLVKPILNKLSLLLKPIFYYVFKENNTESNISNYDNCFSNDIPPNSPPHSIIPNEVSPLLYSLAHIIPELDSFKLSKPIYYCLTSFLKNESLNIRLAALNVLTLYSKYNLTENIKEINYKKLVPPLINLIDTTKSFSYEEFTINSNYRVKQNMTPLYLLSILCKEDDIIIDYLANCKVIDEICDIIIKNYSLTTKTKSEDALHKVSFCFLILSGICSSREHYREQVIKFKLSPITVDILSNHIKILAQYNKVVEIGQKPKNADLVLQLSNSITLSTCYFIRSLSRSVSLLRTYLLDLKITDLLLKILKQPQVITDDCDLKDGEVILKSVVLGIISNFVLDFSAFKEDIVKSEISSLLAEFITTSDYDMIKIYSLAMIRNFLYGINDNSTKDKFINKISLEKIFELCYSPNVKIQEQCFNIIRNLCSGSLNYSDKIISEFNISKIAKLQKEKGFLDFLNKKLSTLDPAKDVELMSSICYILVHLAASNENNRSRLMANISLLKTLLRVLDDYKVDSKIKLPCIWIIINLTWKDDTSPIDNDSSSTPEEDADEEDDQEEVEADAEAEVDDDVDADVDDDDDVMDVDEELPSKVPKNSNNNSDISNRNNNNVVRKSSARQRVRKLTDMGFYSTIKNFINSSYSLDIKERAKTALFQLNAYE
ncbi:hypothetical protein PACTADRAFT_17521 [Pachysolen tannophilus NRRL Y-2460]|uniref:Armadillo repeat-containing protein 8 n=1 Tax=Pachysolen tannophilus NRRL Y-2460 TaxID=669874 RepID=A0A1E4TSW5_PACTA|nr:hypothetical protein PACTADRAFT_17521 [Pachysolen tannophilus NRRL Y-2460]